MFSQLAQVDMSIYFQIVIFTLFLIILLRLHWKMGSFVQIFSSTVKYCVFILIFIYLFLNWASDVNPTLRSSSVLIMTLINLYMLWQSLIAGVEVSYRRCLRKCAEGTSTVSDLEQAFSSGKRYYKFRYFWTSLGSGLAPWRYLRMIAAERTRDDLHHVFRNLDPKASIFGASLFVNYLDTKLAADKTLSTDKRDTARRVIEMLRQEPWLSEKTGDFLDTLLASPADLLDAGLKEALHANGKTS